MAAKNGYSTPVSAKATPERRVHAGVARDVAQAEHEARSSGSGSSSGRTVRWSTSPICAARTSAAAAIDDQRREEHRRARGGQPGEVEQGRLLLLVLVAPASCSRSVALDLLVQGRDRDQVVRLHAGRASTGSACRPARLPAAAPGRSASGTPTSGRTASRRGVTLPAVSGASARRPAPVGRAAPSPPRPRRRAGRRGAPAAAPSAGAGSSAGRSATRPSASRTAGRRPVTTSEKMPPPMSVIGQSTRPGT